MCMGRMGEWRWVTEWRISSPGCMAKCAVLIDALYVVVTNPSYIYAFVCLVCA